LRPLHLRAKLPETFSGLFIAEPFAKFDEPSKIAVDPEGSQGLVVRYCVPEVLRHKARGTVQMTLEEAPPRVKDDLQELRQIPELFRRDVAGIPDGPQALVPAIALRPLPNPPDAPRMQGVAKDEERVMGD
jgi:hypothetical protein